jgi:hypothetical protein
LYFDHFSVHVTPTEILISDSDSPLKTASYPTFMKEKL